MEVLLEYSKYFKLLKKIKKVCKVVGFRPQIQLLSYFNIYKEGNFLDFLIFEVKYICIRAFFTTNNINLTCFN